MNGSPFISVICPVYNAEKVLSKCIRSVIEQDFKDIEFILVNDGSTDRSLKVCLKYAAKDDRIIIIDKPNCGRIIARKDGVLKARGEYVFFIDSDDYIENNAIGKLANLALKHSLDMVVGYYDRVFDSWGIISKRKDQYEKTFFEKANKLIGNNELLEQMLRLDLTKGGGVENLMWGRLYRRSCILSALQANAEYLFPSNKYSVNEDGAFNLAIAPYVHSCVIINEVIYHYRYGGSTSRFFPYISRGGYYFDFRYEMCQRYDRLDLLSYVYSHYKKLLSLEIQGRKRFNGDAKESISEFVNDELSHRKIAQWAIMHFHSTVAIETRKIIEDVVRIPAKKKRVWLTACLAAYMKVASFLDDCISS